jgi:hypothetical protein
MGWVSRKYINRGCVIGSTWVTLCGVLYSGAWVHAESPDRLEEALNTLNQVPAGQDLLKQALKVWKLGKVPDIMDNLQWGSTSRTDTVLTRHYNPKTGQEDRERHVTVVLKQDQTEVELILDLAHELVHATARPSFDPYDPQLTPGKYIRAAIEGEGGEVDAVTTECTVALQLTARLVVPIQRCKNYYQNNKSHSKRVVDREKVRGDFYRVGKWQTELQRRLGSEARLFTLLTRDEPKLYSSTGHAPYPIALLKEFEEITEMACDNTRKRITSVAAREPASVLAASTSAHILGSNQQEVQKFMHSRCK